MDVLLIGLSTVALSVYSVLVKRFPHKLVLLFLLNLSSYVGFLAIYFVRTAVLQHDTRALYELIFIYTYQDLALYVVIALASLGSMVLSERLLDGYDLSVVVPLSQLGLLLASAGYLALGDPFEWTLPLGFLALSAGAIVVSLAAAPDPSPGGKPGGATWSRARLWTLVLLQGLLFAVVSIVTYTGTKQTTATASVLTTLNRLHIGPMAYHGAFFFNLGSQLVSILAFLAYILARRHHRRQLVPALTTHVGTLAAAVIAYFVTQASYLAAFGLTRDTTILLALDNLSTPVILALSWLTLHETLDRRTLLGSGLIVAGGIATAL
jgi:drug/metabolite transporter (DMT)-like permease